MTAAGAQARRENEALVAIRAPVTGMIRFACVLGALGALCALVPLTPVGRRAATPALQQSHLHAI